MKMRKRCVTAIAGAILSTVSLTRANIISITDTPPVTASGTAGSDYLLYQQTSPTQISVNNSASVLSVLSGTKSQTSPGGNIRLYASSDGTPLNTFQTASHVTLSGTLNSHSISVSSLNGNDWFTTPTGYNTSFGANNLATTWFNSFLKNYNFSTVLAAGGYGNQIASQEYALYEGFLTYSGQGGGGYQHLSGPSVSYVQQDTTAKQINIGLADTDGYLEPLINAYVAAFAPNISSSVPTVYASKVVGISLDGGPETFDWNFSQQSSGLTTTDSTASDNLEFQVSVPAPVPEPASAGLLAAAAVTSLLRCRRSHVADSSNCNGILYNQEPAS